MKKFIMMIFIIAFLLVSCSSIVSNMEMDEIDRNYIFLPTDIDGLNHQDYTIKPLKNGSDYYFNKVDDKNNGLYFFYSITLINNNGEEIKVTTTLSILKNDLKAVALYKSSTKILNLLHKSSIVNVVPSEFNADQALVVNTNDYFSLALQNNNMFYEVDIEGIKLDISQVKENIINKFNAATENLKY